MFHGHKMGTKWAQSNLETKDKVMVEDRKALIIFRLRERGFEPLRRKPLDPKSSASANSATLAHLILCGFAGCVKPAMGSMSSKYIS